MIAVIFELEPHPDRRQAYFGHAAELARALEDMPGFVSVERFESLTSPGRFLSLSFWADEASVAVWRAHGAHREAQRQGRAEVFRDYRLRVAHVVRDYGLRVRDEAPADSRRANG
jgi:heme-degrading monooxygenase HmoA